MRRFVIALVIILVNTKIAYCQPQYKQNLKNIATITFPDTPKIKIISGETAYYSHGKRSTYICEAIPLTTSLADILRGGSVDTFYAIFINGVLAPTKSHVFYKNNIVVNDLKGVEFGFKFQVKNNTCYSYQNVFYLNDVLINYSYLSLDSLDKNDKKITDFFKTFKLSINKSEVRQSNEKELAYKTGSVVGRVLAIISIIGIIVLLGLGVVFIIRKLT